MGLGLDMHWVLHAQGDLEVCILLPLLRAYQDSPPPVGRIMIDTSIR